jgi:hydrogenase maturation protein HypF
MAAPAPASRVGGPVRRRLRVRGLVQGVGFRPFVYRLAGELGLSGQVGNDSAGVFIEVEGPAAAVGRFEARLRSDAPPLARVDDIASVEAEAQHRPGFAIVESASTGPARTYVSPDIAVCADCLAEMHDPADRRYRYPFVNCTNCGPRFTITIRLPYDRANTTMARFRLCADCAREYHDPADRRYHAQPVACPACGPRLWYEDSAGRVEGTDEALEAARSALQAGRIVAVKGLGGYHLACDAHLDAAVDLLRSRKARPAKPLAVMVADLAAAEVIADIAPAEAGLLASPARPIVLLRSKGALSPLVAPDHPLVGVMLPYTPLHHLLLQGMGPLVMTSGNLSDEPICYDDGDARARLGAVADAWLCHDRPIHVPCDDSVVRWADGAELPIRRSRGYAPVPIRLPFEVGPTLAVGGDLKNTFCLGEGRDAWMSQHIGDMGHVETLVAFERSVAQFTDMYGVIPARVVADSHPGYHTRRWAGEAAVPVQHHHAHVAAVMVEHQLPAGREVLAFAFDGTGYGPDGAIWGGEVLRAGYDRCRRLAHLAYVPLPGGDSAVRRPYRVALSLLRAAGVDWSADLPPAAAAGPDELRVLDRQLERGVACVATSSVGRLFDAVSSLLGIRHVATYEAEAAVELEARAQPFLDRPARYRMALDPAGVIRAMVADLRAGVPVGAIAAGFHLALADLVADLAAEWAGPEVDATVALCGGVWQNAVLLGLTRARLADRGWRVLTHRQVPPNDGGLALGQLVVGR